MAGRGRKSRPWRRPAPKDPSKLRVDSILTSSFSSLKLDARLKEYKLKKAWTSCVGRSVAKKAAPVSLIGTTLFCAVTSSPWMAELNFHKARIIKKLNEALGEGTVKELVFRPGEVAQEPDPGPPAEKKPPRPLTEAEKRHIEETAEPVTDPALKDLIKRVMEKVKSGDFD
ncbi:MAG: DUF721 domain-containing protein [Thermodesulfobacteriota bacterium]